MNARDYLTSSDSYLVIARCVAFTVLWICVRWVASNVVFSNVEPALRVRQGTKSVIVVHSAFQAIAAVWLVSYDPVVAPLLREVASRPTSLDLANVNSPGVTFLATVAAGEFTCQMLHLYYWYEKKSDLIMVAHHTFSALIWPLGVAAHRSQFFIANMLFYEISTPFMALLHFFKDWKTTYAVLGTLFTLSFVLVRLVTVPITFYFYYLTWDTWIVNSPTAKPWVGPFCMALEKIFVPLPILMLARRTAVVDEQALGA